MTDATLDDVDNVLILAVPEEARSVAVSRFDHLDETDNNRVSDDTTRHSITTQ